MGRSPAADDWVQQAGTAHYKTSTGVGVQVPILCKAPRSILSSPTLTKKKKVQPVRESTQQVVRAVFVVSACLLRGGVCGKAD